ncbi:hypothetical protein ACBR40_05590 [Nonomuraea sp. AD125B]
MPGLPGLLSRLLAKGRRYDVFVSNRLPEALAAAWVEADGSDPRHAHPARRLRRARLATDPDATATGLRNDPLVEGLVIT